MVGAEDAADAVTDDLFEHSVLPYECLLAVCLAAGQRQSCSRVGIQRVIGQRGVDEDPVRDASIASHVRLSEVGFTTEVGGQLQSTAPLCCIEGELHVLLCLGGMDQGQRGRVALGEVVGDSHDCGGEWRVRCALARFLITWPCPSIGVYLSNVVGRRRHVVGPVPMQVEAGTIP